MDRPVEAEPRFRGRVAGILYLFDIASGSLALVSLGRIALPANRDPPTTRFYGFGDDAIMRIGWLTPPPVLSIFAH